MFGERSPPQRSLAVRGNLRQRTVLHTIKQRAVKLRRCRSAQPALAFFIFVSQPVALSTPFQMRSDASCQCGPKIVFNKKRQEFFYAPAIHYSILRVCLSTRSRYFFIFARAELICDLTVV